MVKNRLPEGDPYAGSKTELQWRKENRAVIDQQGSGRKMWSNQFCHVSAIYYKLDETRPATPEDVAAWEEERQAKEQEQQRRAQEKMVAEEAREKGRKERLLARLHRHIEVNPADIICLDTETTGVYGNDEILQLSVINGNGEVLFNELLRPKNVAEWPGAEAIHGISPDMVTGKPTIDQYMPQLNSIMSAAKLIIGYNLQFDLGFLRRAGIEWPKETQTFDVMTEFAEIYGEWNNYFRDYKWQKLCVCAEYFGYEGNGNFHDSLEDIRATLFCYYAMAALTEGDL